MNYDLTLKEERRKFVKRCNALLAKQRDNVSLVDESKRTPNQNCYLHVLCRILAQYTGESEYYAKQVYFKQLANPELFITVNKDELTGQMIKRIRSSTELTIQEMSKAIQNFFIWAIDVANCQLPEATFDEQGNAVFSSDEAKQAFHQATIMTSKEIV